MVDGTAAVAGAALFWVGPAVGEGALALGEGLREAVCEGLAEAERLGDADAEAEAEGLAEGLGEALAEGLGESPGVPASVAVLRVGPSATVTVPLWAEAEPCPLPAIP
ncbi:hypothetical protein OG455_28660 [Kitasatospora sp. NBC_01287]|nr:hypothetical protein [Kitasatospora sp. NBC_01287]